jgi:phytoene dehydrogenase-like protein
MPHYDAIIIGAGMSGLAAGIRLAMFDKRVVILERHYVWGGLNSFYQLGGRQFDVGLHALTNYAPRNARGSPLTRLLKQLRIRWDELDLHEQGFSAISFPDVRLRFSNEFALLRGEVARAFPNQADGFDALTREVLAYNELDLDAPRQDARPMVRAHIQDPLLEDMLFCPLMFYGSAREHDMDWDQFVVLFKSIFMEGFARPQQGVRHILKLLIERYRNAGGELRLKSGVARILTDARRAVGVELEDGSQLTADRILSSAGLTETARLAGSGPLAPGRGLHTELGSDAVRRLSFVESLSVLDCPADQVGIEETIVFFSNRVPFEYAQPKDDVDVNSGVICMPDNFRLSAPLTDHLVRITNLASYSCWTGKKREEESADDEYRAAKRRWYAESCEKAVRHVAEFRPRVKFVDMFTPRTIRHFTGHDGGAVYGSPWKLRTGETTVQGLHLMGTDQGYLGIIGAALSGITIANRWVLQGEQEHNALADAGQVIPHAKVGAEHKELAKAYRAMKR